jgi:ABC-type transport system substrate-binding protein
LRRTFALAICLLLLAIISTVTVAWLGPWRSVQDAVKLKSYTSLVNAVQGLLRGEVDLLPIDKFDLQILQRIENDPRVKLVSIPSFDFTYIGLNLRKWPLSDYGFRRAMLYAFNRDEVLKNVLGGFGEKLHPGLFSSAYSISGWTRYALDQYSYNISTASRILDAEGFNTSSQAQFRLDRLSRKPLRTMFVISRLSEPDEVATADLFAKDMQSLGLPIISLPMSDFDMTEAFRTYTFDIFIDSRTNNFAPTWLQILFDSKNDVAPVPLGTNLVGYDNSTFDKYVDEYMSASDQSELQNATEICQEILAHGLPVLPVFSKDILIAARPQLNVISVVGNLEDTIRKTAVNTTQDSRFSLPVRIGFTSEFKSLDPTTTSNLADWVALHLVTEPLLTFDQDGKAKPDLVQWTQSYKTLTLSVRPGTKFYTGQNITANDVATTLNWLMTNVKPSSSIYSLENEVTRVEVIDQSTLKISLSSPDKFAIYQFTDLFALPANRLTSNPGTPDFLANQLLVSSGPFVIREFTQTEGVTMQINSLYFGQPRETVKNFDAFESGTVLGARVFSGSLVKVSSSLIFDGQPIENASYVACVYDQDGVVSECTRGSYTGHGSYLAAWRIDSRFHSGTYRVETTLYWVLPVGEFVIFNEETMTIHRLPVFLSILVLIAIMGGIVISLRLQRRAPRVRIKRRAAKRARRRRRDH